ncbi:hypothetical protein Salat_1306000 [Sesamum alatum]|uniref:Uncharacterized protein n=1 Tax=Sesamum alatum TaxID=300844 RepID=A0AAE2CPT5_9LAMI|nr:hypothetical protein Salat_1306000 [Sesamum alatum]
MTVSFLSLLANTALSSVQCPVSSLPPTTDMVSSLLNASLIKPSHISSNRVTIPSRPLQEKFLPFLSCKKKAEHSKPTKISQEFVHSPALIRTLSQKSVIPIAAAVAILFWTNPAHAGFLSGLSGIESVPGPQLPQVDFLNRFNEENQKRYAENDARFKESPLLKKLLEKTKLNKEKNRQEILDKYCIRGAEWGVGDCSAEAMSPEDKENFIAMLKKKAGVE